MGEIALCAAARWRRETWHVVRSGEELDACGLAAASAREALRADFAAWRREAVVHSAAGVRFRRAVAAREVRSDDEDGGWEPPAEMVRVAVAVNAARAVEGEARRNKVALAAAQREAVAASRAEARVRELEKTVHEQSFEPGVVKKELDTDTDEFLKKKLADRVWGRRLARR